MDESLPTISVVTPSFNQAAFLPECIESVLRQGYPRLEYMILDGGSTDGSREIIDRYADRCTYVRSRADEGQAAALREGFARASGEVLGWLNSDDRLAEGALWRVAETWQRHGGEKIIVGACQIFDEHGPVRRHRATFQRALDRPEPLPIDRILDVARQWFPGRFFYQPEVFFPRSSYQRIDGIDPRLHYAMDYDLWVRLAIAGTPAVVIDETLAWFRRHDGQKTNAKAAMRREVIDVANGHLRHAPLSPDVARRLAGGNLRALNYFAWRAYQLPERLRRALR